MLEVLFSDSAAGSMAVGIGRKGYIGGAVSLFVSRSGGGKPSKAELRRLQREAEARDRRNWEQAVGFEGSREDIFCFPLGLSVGGIAGDCLGPERKAALEMLMGTYPETEGEAEKTLEKARRSLATLLSRAADGEPLRVWTSAQPDESCGLCWLMERLCDARLEGAEVIIVTLPDLEERDDGTIVRYGGWGEIAPCQWGAMAALGRRLPTNLIRACASRWAELKEENASLRAMLNGLLVSAPEDLYDSFILRELDKQDGQFNEAALIGAVLGRHRLGIGDAWVALRVESFIERGLLSPVTEPDSGGPAYRRILRKI